MPRTPLAAKLDWKTRLLALLLILEALASCASAANKYTPRAADENSQSIANRCHDFDCSQVGLFPPESTALTA